MKRHIVLNKNRILKSIAQLESLDDLTELAEKVRILRNSIGRSSMLLSPHIGDDKVTVSKVFLAEELDQIASSHTVERAHYYLGRLRKALTSVKNGTMNDLNLRRWKEYRDLWTDSLWIVPRRDSAAGHSAWYWGNFIPQIPHQLLLRYTKKGECVLDPFVGSGTTLLECLRLGRNGFGIELNKSIAGKTAASLKKRDGTRGTVVIEVGDSATMNVADKLKGHGMNSVQFVILHPPYHDIIRFSASKRDLSNAPSTKHFLEMLGKVVDNSLEVLDKGRMLALVIGDKYSKRNWIPLGFFSMNEIMKRDCTLKSIIVKNFDQTTGKRNQEALWRYRALVGGFYVFKHEYIFIFQKN